MLACPVGLQDHQQPHGGWSPSAPDLQSTSFRGSAAPVISAWGQECGDPAPSGLGRDPHLCKPPLTRSEEERRHCHSLRVQLRALWQAWHRPEQLSFVTLSASNLISEALGCRCSAHFSESSGFQGWGSCGPTRRPRSRLLTCPGAEMVPGLYMSTGP